MSTAQHHIGIQLRTVLDALEQLKSSYYWDALIVNESTKKQQS